MVLAPGSQDWASLAVYCSIQ